MTDYETDRTALLIVDPYNDFMSEGGKLFDAIRDTAESVNFFDNLRRIISAVRAAGISVLILPHHRAHEHAFVNWKHMTPFQKSGVPLKAFEVGTWGGEFNEEFGPRGGDVVVQEHWAQSGFANTDLDLQLRQRGIEKIILVGVIANSCIESTARFGMELGYHVTLVRDGAAAFSQEGMDVAFNINGPTYAHSILTTEDLLAQIHA
ncbi:isochorismatase family cysteine hydrolase [Rhizobium leguminosarum]|uniref:isochorismatase family cysteine hydrolase n=1 Tax=Rhizobium leguminosarum TaxID=384 RepID=UPI00143F9E9F|nr:isochorismatase family cysteine hydrolase [Rhizobium leguminosarum]NKL21773.1 isochorismatase family protein [Rhizobium leguminosarum bv. viciae]